ncbi:Cobyrinic acid A,C-diamide synthase [Thermodesulfobium narugense DSM 14796]|uniref:Cobyrinate a,c-diamide synthase n=1 Tax=Thermodesulfobium narugense DSM 14796 TaxID=747365 RepID=M1E710_9BACT|nr:cobyrinate a,c-diamide synthase [Thermodesulfobium narugense]AEE14270.1 Cobyrinic acid A,C-diamide synthase [Thermodesulfobium narugense DSM 14796]
MSKSFKKILVSAPFGRSGKTSFSIGLARALSRKGYRVQTFKKGPDFIDPSWLSMSSGRPCRNLDLFMMDKETILSSFMTNSIDADISVVEGAMGLYDGIDYLGTGSTAEIAKIIDIPVIFVLPVQRITRSSAALIKGYVEFDKEIDIKGIILNKVARDRQKNLIINALEHYNLPDVLASFPKDDKRLSIPDRHLGLIPAKERLELNSVIDSFADAVDEHMNWDLFFDIIRKNDNLSSRLLSDLVSFERFFDVRIGIIQDVSFSFYYPEVFDFLKMSGAKIEIINSLTDKHLPDIDILYIGGGFPEVFAKELEGNDSLRRSIKDFGENNNPIYAECGGLMYLSDFIENDGNKYNMVGLLPFGIHMDKKPVGHGYEEIEVFDDNPFFSKGIRIKGHEFHHSSVSINRSADIKFSMKVLRGNGIMNKLDGVVYKRVMASYLHIHPLGFKDFIVNLLKSVYI